MLEHQVFFVTLSQAIDGGERLNAVCRRVRAEVKFEKKQLHIQMYTYISVLVNVGAGRGAEVEILQYTQ